MAPAFGEDDFRVMRENGLQEIPCPLDNHGKFTSQVSDYEGTEIKKADNHIIKNIQEKGLLLERSTIVHSYPMCPRSDKPTYIQNSVVVVYKVESLKQRLLEANAKINWIPSHLQQGRFGKWLANARNWAVSRNRVWGTPIPIWYNETIDKYHCIGSKAELESLSGVKVSDLHRDHIDDITFSLENEEG